MSAENEPAGTDNTSPTPNEPAADPAKQSPKPEGSDDTPQGQEPNADPNKDAPNGKDDTDPTGAPEAYADFTVPDGMEIDTALLAEVSPLFKEDGLTQEQAQRYIDKYAARIQSMGEGAGEALDKAFAERKQAETAEQSEQWLEAVKADKEIGGDKLDSVKTRVIEAVGAVATPEAKQAFDELGWGNHPELIRLVNRLIDYTPQDKGERPAGAGGAERGIANRLYPNME